MGCIMILHCGDYCREVNVPKCAVVVFGQRAVGLTGPADLLPLGGWLSVGQPVPLVTEFQYLGIVSHQTQGVSASVSALHSAGLHAV